MGDKEGITPLILNLGTRWSTVVSFTNPLSCPREGDPIHHKTEKRVGRRTELGNFEKRKIAYPYSELYKSSSVVQPKA
jgi:hypothetical protein